MGRGLTTALRRVEPNGVLAVAAALETLIEAVRIETGSTLWLVLSAVVALAALGLAWRTQDRLRLIPVCLVAVSFHLALIAVHLLLGETGDQDPRAYTAYGNDLLHGTYPQSEYPTGGVLLFALEALPGGSAETPNRFLMVPFQLICVVAVWSLRTRYSSWLAAVIAIWPMSTYYWQYRFDLVPAALIVLGLLLAYRGRWGWSGVALGAGTAVKWSPALSLLVLAVWLAARTRWRELRRTATAFLGVLVLFNIPFLLWEPGRVIETYRGQGSRAITNESIWFFPLSLLGLTGGEPRMWAAAGAPDWAGLVAVSVQASLLLGILALAARTGATMRRALVLAALAPVVFLLTNRVFSAQFLLVITAAAAFAGALAVVRRAEQLLLGLLLMAATFANAFVYPYEDPLGVASWRPFSAVMFVAAVLATGGILIRAVWTTSEGAAPVHTAESEGEGFGDSIRKGRDMLTALRERTAGVGLPRWSGHVLGWLTILLVVVFAVPTLFAASVLPYRYWDSLAYGAWSRSISQTGSLWANAGVLDLSRPLFYVPQGLAWRILGEEEWVGRLLSVLFGAVLVGAVWSLAGKLTPDRDARQLARMLAVGILLSSSVFAGLVAAGMTDVPVAAAAATTGAVLWSTRLGRAAVALVALCAAATVLAKASGLLALAGLGGAVLLLRGRRALPGITGIAIGAAAALLYDAWQASRLDVTLLAFLKAGNEGFWLERGAAARWDAVGRAEWLGEGIRLLVLFGLIHAVARVAGARPPLALAVSGAAAIGWSIVGPAIADGEVPYPFDGNTLGLVAWLALAGAMVAAPLLAAHDPIGRRTYAALLCWVTPTAVAWFLQRADEVRHLAPAWPAFVLLSAAGLASLSRALSRARPGVALLPVGAVLVLALANVVAIDGLGTSGWRGLLDLGPSRWSDRAETENYAYGPFSAELNLARANVAAGDRLVTSDGRLRYFFPAQTEVGYPRSCSELAGARFFSLHLAGESLEFAQREGQPTDPLGWLQCSSPHVQLVGEQQGIYAAFVVGAPPASPSTPADCRISSTAGQLEDGVFGDGLSYSAGKSLRERALASGFTGTRIEQTGCSTFRVVVTGVPAKKSVQTELRKEVEGVGLSIDFLQAVRYPEVPADVAAVR